MLGLCAAAALTCTVSAAVIAWRPEFAGSMLALGSGATLLQLVWVHGRAQSRARRSEIVRSFARLTVLHNGVAVRIDDSPLVGEYAARRDAGWAAARCGRWAVIVRAYDRYYVLSGERVAHVRTPVSFRSKAVSDVVPAMFEEALGA